MANNETLGASFSIDVTDLKAGLNAANRLIRESESEFRAAAAGMDDWTESEDGLNAKIKSLNQITEVQRKKVDALQGEYDRLIRKGLDPTSKEAVELRTKINNETAALNKNEAELKKQTQALKDLETQSDKTGDETEELGGKFEKLKGIGGGAVKAIAAIGAAVAGVATGFFSLAESTREARNNMAKLETSFQTAGLSAEDAEQTFTDLYGIMGDEGAATEAAQQLAKISKDEADLAANTRILTGVMAEYGNSIPLEGLAEGIASSSAMSSVQGVLADALEWQGVNLEDYNAKLATLATEEERAAYIQSTLTDLYGASADAYRENNAEVIAAQEAQANLNSVMNELGAIAEPIMTSIKNIAADLLTSITPFVTLIGEGLTGALNGTAGAADKLAEGVNGLITFALEKIVSLLPFIIETIVAIVPTLITELLGLLPTILQTLIDMVVQVAQMLGDLLPTLVPLVIDTLLLMVETLLDNLDLIIDAALAIITGLADGLLIALPRLIEKIPVIIDKLVDAIVTSLPQIYITGVDLILQLTWGILKAVPQLLKQIPSIIMSIIKLYKEGYGNMFEIGVDYVKGLWEGIKDYGGWIKEKIKGFGADVLGSLKDFFGINSPSKVMSDQVGKNLALGIGEGFEENIAGVNKDITDAMNFNDASVNVNASRGGVRGNGVTVYQTNNYKQAYTSRYEQYKSKQELFAAARLVKAGAI